jgi:hypothetical protein
MQPFNAALLVLSGIYNLLVANEVRLYFNNQFYIKIYHSTANIFCNYKIGAFIYYTDQLMGGEEVELFLLDKVINLNMHN